MVSRGAGKDVGIYFTMVINFVAGYWHFTQIKAFINHYKSDRKAVKSKMVNSV